MLTHVKSLENYPPLKEKEGQRERQRQTDKHRQIENFNLGNWCADPDIITLCPSTKHLVQLACKRTSINFVTKLLGGVKNVLLSEGVSCK